MPFGIIQRKESDAEFQERVARDIEDFENGWLGKHNIFFARFALIVVIGIFILLSLKGNFALGVIVLAVGGPLCAANILHEQKKLDALLARKNGSATTACSRPFRRQP